MNRYFIMRQFLLGHSTPEHNKLITTLTCTITSRESEMILSEEERSWNGQCVVSRRILI